MATGVAALVLIAGCGEQANSDPELVLDGSVAGDFGALATETFDEFVASAPGIGRCIGSVRLAAAADLDDLARYSAATATITVRVPATAPSLRDSVVHELAHHVEASCAAHADMRPEFLAAQGHDPNQDWFDAGSWEETPSEEYAEAVVASVLGQRQRNLSRIRLEPEALAVVAEWLQVGAAAGAGGT